MEEIQNRQNDIQPQNNMEEQEIDLRELAMKLWPEKKMILKACGWAALVGLVVAFSIPKEYESTVTLAPELNKERSISGGMAALAGMAGINLGGSSGPDALSPELYPDIVKSVPFSVEMFDVKVTDKDGELNTTLYEYLKEEQKQPWWGYITAAPFKALGWVASTIKGEDEEEGDGSVDSFRLTKDQSKIIKAMNFRDYHNHHYAGPCDSGYSDKRRDGETAELYHRIQDEQGTQGPGIYRETVCGKYGDLS